MMKAISQYLLLSVAAIFNFTEVVAQIPGSYFPHWEADLNFGMCAQGIPTRISRTAIGSGEIDGEPYDTRVQYTGGLYLSATLVPLRLENVSYELIPHISVHWLDKESGFTRGLMHKLVAGKGSLSGVLGFQNMAKMAVLNDREFTDQANGVFNQSYSLYRSDRLHFGIRFTYDQDEQNYFELGVAREKFLKTVEYSTTGFTFLLNHNRTKLQAEYFPKHLIRGNLYGLPPGMPISDLNLATEAMYFQISIRSRIWWRDKW